nr:hypothetical protein [Tanacetum cinerariifolium]
MDMTIDQQVALDEALAFLVTTDVPGIYMQEFKATATVHHHSICFKMDNGKRIIYLEYFREMMHICPRLPGQTFDELPFKEEILPFLRFLGHSGEIRKLTNAHILWGMYHKKNVDFSYLLWEYFVYQVEHKDAKKSNEMYYPQNTQQFVVMLHVELTNEDIRNSEAYKEYYAVASGAASPKTKANVKKTKSSFGTTITPPIAAGIRLLTSAKGKQPAKASKAKSLTVLSEGETLRDFYLRFSLLLNDMNMYNMKLEQFQVNTKFVNTLPSEWTPQIAYTQMDQQSSEYSPSEAGLVVPVFQKGDDPIDAINHMMSFLTYVVASRFPATNNQLRTSSNPRQQATINNGNDDASLGLNVGSEEGQDAEDDDDELYRDVNVNLEGRDVQMTDVQTTQEFEDTHVTLTPVNPDGQQQSSLVSSQFVTSMLNSSPDAGLDSLFKTPPQMDVPASTTVASLTLTAPTLPPLTIHISSQVQQAPTPPTTAPSTFLQDLPNFGSLYMDQRINEAVKVKVQVSKILPKIEKTVNEQLEAEVHTRSSNSSKTSYTVAADLSKMELKKILIEKMESNKSIHRYDEQRNLYKALVKVYESDKIILDTYRDTVTLKRRRDDADKDEEPSAGLDRGFKRRRKGKEPESTSTPKEKATKTTGVESYQKKLNLTKPDTYRSDLKRKEAYTAYSNPRGFIYQNKDKQNRLMRIDELHKFNDGTLNDVRTTLDDHLKGIQMKYLPQAIWRKSDKERAAPMIQANDKQLKTRRIMQSLEKFVGGRLYEGDFRMLQWTI